MQFLCNILKKPGEQDHGFTISFVVPLLSQFHTNIDQVSVIILFLDSFLCEAGLGQYSFIFIFISNLLSGLTCNISASVVFLILFSCYNPHQVSFISVLKSPLRNLYLEQHALPLSLFLSKFSETQNILKISSMKFFSSSLFVCVWGVEQLNTLGHSIC